MSNFSQDDFFLQTQDYMIFSTILQLNPSEDNGKLHHLQAFALEYKRKSESVKKAIAEFNKLSSRDKKREKDQLQLKLDEFQELLQKIRFRCMGYMEELYQSERLESFVFLLQYLPLGPLRDYYNAKLANTYDKLSQQFEKNKVHRKAIFDRLHAQHKIPFDNAEYQEADRDVAAVREKLDLPIFSDERLKIYQQGKADFLKNSYPSCYADEANYLTALLQNKYKLLARCSPHYLPAVCAMDVDFRDQHHKPENLVALQAGVEREYLPAIIFVCTRFISFVRAENDAINGATNSCSLEILRPLFDTKEKFEAAMKNCVEMTYKYDILELKEEIEKIKTIRAEYKRLKPDQTLEFKPQPNENLKTFCKYITAYENFERNGVLQTPRKRNAVSRERSDSFSKARDTLAEVEPNSPGFNRHHLKVSTTTATHVAQHDLHNNDTFLPGFQQWKRASMSPFFFRNKPILDIDSKVQECETLRKQNVDAVTKQQKCLELKADVSIWLSKASFFTPRKRSVERLSASIQLEEQRLQLWLLASNKKPIVFSR